MSSSVLQSDEYLKAATPNGLRNPLEHPIPTFLGRDGLTAVMAGVFLTIQPMALWFAEETLLTSDLQHLLRYNPLTLRTTHCAEGNWSAAQLPH